MKRSLLISGLRPLVVPALVIAGWEAIARLFLIFVGTSPKLVVLPLPTQILDRLVQALREWNVLWSVAHTLFATLLGFSLGIVGAIIVGSLLGASRWAETYVAPSLHFLRSLPVVLYVPITLILIGSDLRAPIFLAAFVTTLYGAVPVIRAVRDYDQE